MNRHSTPRLGGALTALTALGGLLLTGCSSGHDIATTDSNGGRHAPGHARGGERNSDSYEVDPKPGRDHLSTFALDVDTASWDHTRRLLSEGRRPDPSEVRPEEFVNSFRQDYERPDGNGFTVTVDGARTGEENWSLVRVGLATRKALPDSERPPAALTFVVDVSGSMAEPGRLDLARTSLDVMTDRLRDDDSVALVAFTDEAETVLPMTRLGGHRGTVHDAIDSLKVSNSTNLGAGVETGYDTAVKGLRKDATNRVVLISDALANTGDTDPDSILERISTARREHGITLFGVGVGSEYGDALMEQLADKGDGHTAYVSDEDQAVDVFCEQLPRNIDLVARDAKAQVAFDPASVAEFHLIGYDNRRVADDDFRDDRVDGGEVGPGHTVTALYSVRTKPGARGHLATATVRWLDPATRTPHEESGRLEAAALRGDVWKTGPRFQVDAVAAYFADTLRTDGARHSSLPGAPGLPALAERAGRLAQTTGDQAVRQLHDAIVDATDL
ncbi:VWA domain-containing protein [Streptomyces sp. XM83C]|jgi:Ca-activated chloride channel family protein|uniref:von Willebrand factor type A domain-containing protein n=1 Tax=Streptomyces thermocoprophilus TaxID=78356 RepID=A0ABV5V992_9ACTN|nr:VWA domain-containing protein [Streptomyces sp. XM83C]MCK1820689.1 VWA domain-containing protein [Streptomyces sp. XM83C]